MKLEKKDIYLSVYFKHNRTLARHAAQLFGKKL